MGIFKGRQISFGEILLAFGAIAFPVHVWAIYNILENIPALLLYMTSWELAGVIGYALVMALLESCVLTLVMVVFSFLLPREWLAAKFVALSSVLMWVLTAWAAVASIEYDFIQQLGSIQMVIGLFFVLVTMGLAYWLVQWSSKLEDWIKKIVQSLSILSYLYAAFDLLGLVVIILRNI